MGKFSDFIIACVILLFVVGPIVAGMVLLIINIKPNQEQATSSSATSTSSARSTSTQQSECKEETVIVMGQIKSVVPIDINDPDGNSLVSYTYDYGGKTHSNKVTIGTKFFKESIALSNDLTFAKITHFGHDDCTTKSMLALKIDQLGKVNE